MHVTNLSAAHEFHVYAKNARCLKSDDDIEQLLAELRDMKWDAVLISETWRPAKSEKWRTTTGHLFAGSGGVDGSRGVAILLHSHWVTNESRFQAIDERICALDVDLGICKLRLTSVYFPHTGYGDLAVEKCYTTLSELHEEARSEKQMMIIGGDFNAEVGTANDECDGHPTLGPHGHPDHNARGEMMRRWVAMRELVIGNTHFEKDAACKWTHESSSKRRRVIDYLLFSKGLWDMVSDVEATFRLDLGSDHRAVHAQLKLRGDKRQRRKRRKLRGWPPRDKYEYDNRLATVLAENGGLKHVGISQDLTIITDKINDRCQQIEFAIQEAAAHCQQCDSLCRGSAEKTQSRLKDLITLRRRARQQGENVTVLSKQIQREARAQSRARRRAEVARILETFRGLKYILDAGKTKGRDQLCSLKDASGTVHSDKKGIVEVFATFYEDLYKSQDQCRAAATGYRSAQPDVEPFTMEELVSELRSLKSGKCPDSAGLVAEMLKDPSPALASAFLSLFNSVLCTGALPPERWRTSVTTVIFKAGDAQLAQNYRPISILSITYKLFSRLLLGRVKPFLEKVQTVDQAGFRAGYSCSDHLFCLSQLQEKSREWQQDVWVVAVDYTKAFDTVSHSRLFEALHAQGLPSAYVELLQSLYSNQSATVRTDCESRRFQISRGVRQGDPISPILFNAALEEVMKKCKARWLARKFGVNVDGNTNWLTNLRFADDLLLVAGSLEDLTEMICDLSLHSSEFGLEIHPEKTKVLGNVPARRRSCGSSICAGGLEIEILNFDGYVKYLGRRISFDEPDAIEVRHRVNIGWKKFHMLKHILCNRRYPLAHRIRVFEATVTGSVLYGSECWTLSLELQHHLRKTQRHMLRSMLQSGRRRVQQDSRSDTSSTTSAATDDSDDSDGLEPWVEWIQRVTREAEMWLEKLAIQPWVQLQRRKKHQWAGHIARRDDGRWSAAILDWCPEPGARQGGAGRGRRQARPKQRWSDELAAHVVEFTGDAEIHWRLLASDRTTWKSLEDDFACGDWRDRRAT